MNKRVINNRPIVFFALTLIVGIFVTSLNIDSLPLKLTSISLALVVAGVLLFIKKYKLLYFPLAFILGVGLLSSSYGIYKTRVINTASNDITATISTEIVDYDGYYSFSVENISVDGTKVKGSAVVYCYKLPTSRAGDEIKIDGKIKTRDFNMDGIFSSNYHNGRYYKINAKQIDHIGKGNLSFQNKININLKRNLYEYADDTTADITSALLFGNKYAIDENLYENIKDSGLAHIFAVSGLHIGILAGAIMLLLKKIKINNVVKGIITIALLLLYAGLCGFPSSVIRAIIMIAVFMFANILGEQRDNLNSLALSAIIILCIYPTDLFSLGFMLSFMAVLGIILFTKPIKNKLKFLPNFVGDIISQSISATLLTWPILIIYFDAVQPLFLLSNLLLLPILPFIYIIMLIITLFVQIIPQTAPMLVVLIGITWPLKFVSTLIGGLSFASIYVPSCIMLAIGYYLLVILLSRFVFLKKSTKVKCSMLVLAFSITFSVLLNCLL